MFSFLNPHDKTPGFVHNSIEDLHIDELIDILEPEKESRLYIRGILEDFENDKETIIYRQEVIQDFIDNETLYNDLCGYFKSSLFIGDTFRALKKEKLGIQKFFSTYNSDNYDTIGTVFRRYAQVIIDILGLYKNINKYLNKYKFNSGCLQKFKDIVVSTVNNKAFKELEDLMEKIIGMKGTYDILVTMNDRFSVMDTSIILDYKTEKAKQSFSLFKKKNAWETNLVDVNEKTLFEMDYFISVSVIQLVDLLTTTFESLYDIFSSTANEIKFINFAINYYNLIKKLKLETIYPKFNTEVIDYNDLYDPYLAIKAYFEQGIILKVCPNNFLKTKEDGGVLVIGENNTGKTVYTRSIGINQIFAQSGLMVTAHDANIKIQKQIITCYASKESHEFDGGRFETEVRALKYILDEADNNTLIIVNEIFQSTAYDEGCDALYNVLSYMTSTNINWICVSHFLDLEDRRNSFYEDTKKNICLMRTRLEEVNSKNKQYVYHIEFSKK